MSQLTINEYDSKYKAFATFNGHAHDLFSSIRVEKHCSNSPDGLGEELWLNVAGHFNGKSIYIQPNKELSDLIQSKNIYGSPVFRDVYLYVEQFGDHYVLGFTFQQIIGGYKLIELTTDQYYELCNITALPFGVVKKAVK
jgi:hypothetical protein